MSGRNEEHDYDPDNEETDSHNDENNFPKNEITLRIDVMKYVIRTRDRGVKYDVDQQFV
jgi:hypothetical protein